jgi:dolichol-phosphate mannosyltransferase
MTPTLRVTKRRHVERTVITPTRTAGPRPTSSTDDVLVAPLVQTVFVIPAYNEEANLPRLFADLERRPGLFSASSRLLMVDDGSRDATAAIIEGYDGPLPVELVSLGRNQGPGAAFRAGFREALAHCSDDALIVTLEADNTSDLDALTLMLARAQEGADLVLASWVMVNVSRLRRALSRGSSVFVRAALGVEAKTVSSFFRVYRASALRSAFECHGDDLIREPGFACKAEILAKMAALGARVDEVPVGLDSSQRVGKSKMPIVRTTLTYWRMCARQRLARGTSAA